MSPDELDTPSCNNCDLKSSVKQANATDLQAVLNSYRELLTLLFGFAVPTAVITLMSSEDGMGLAAVAKLSAIQILSFLVFILCTIRFYHGNMVHFSESSHTRTQARTGIATNSARKLLPLDFVMTVSQGTAFIAAAVTIKDSFSFFILTSLICLTDVVWTSLSLILDKYTSIELPGDVLKRLNVWFFLNLMSFVALAGCLTSLYYGGNNSVLLYVCCAILLLTSILDIQQNWKYYFPCEGL